jgi:SAM-dependent methyltransferase
VTTRPAFRCLVCRGGASEAWLLDCPDYYLALGAPADYHACSACGLIQQHPIPDDVTPLYADYPLHNERSRLFDQLRRWLARGVHYAVAAEDAGGVLLDYGCGDGSYLAAQRGKSCDLLGFELDPAHAMSLADRLALPIYSDRDALLADRHGQISIITMHYSLEHVADLHTTFATASALLRPGGRLYAVVPNARSWEARWFRRRWHGLDPPRHVSFPDRRAVDTLAAQHGLTVTREDHARFPQTVAGSLSVVAGRSRSALLAAALPLGLAASAVAPSGSTAFTLRRS